MTQIGYLDTGVLIGFCLTVDSHHEPCSEYLSTHPDEIYSGERVEREYDNTAETVVQRYTGGVRRHRVAVQSSSYTGELGPSDLRELQQSHLAPDNPTRDTIAELYDQLPQVVYVDTVVDYLRKLERDIEQMELDRRDKLDDAIVDYWCCDDSHPEVRSAVDLHEPDLTICVEGHDLAETIGGTVELATANPTDFVDDGTDTTIESATALSGVVDCTTA
jgi:hypothetical protein